MPRVHVGAHVQRRNVGARLGVQPVAGGQLHLRGHVPTLVHPAPRCVPHGVAAQRQPLLHELPERGAVRRQSLDGHFQHGQRAHPRRPKSVLGGIVGAERAPIRVAPPVVAAMDVVVDARGAGELRAVGHGHPRRVVPVRQSGQGAPCAPRRRPTQRGVEQRMQARFQPRPTSAHYFLMPFSPCAVACASRSVL